ncbi:recombinase family protein [Anaerotignum lactatifermentans]|uniref:Recombinase family protein n=1 Tax=Anaerotignum lactatifermentans TaxID=160404 RepID=A0ABS2GCS5_9FIRM|nr:recombinase family protein [Anaerotignum lactatifermentans]MBM6829909.1 recombinase family protein [Anaerotignum lactatifermentans]MBM6878412.1 recombinase family protein [Anaerotignum lactatifermentans]MBM6951566.1 recombinase family protein [Anaerotignum lactatifermentans]
MRERAALYCRLSVEDAGMAVGEESQSISNQKSLLLAYAGTRGWEVAGVYADEDYSGLREDRPGFQALLRDAAEGRFSIILCKTQSRFTRNMATAERYLHELFPLWGVRFVTVVDGVDTARKENKKARQINSLVNEWYSEELSENIRAVFRRKMEQGQFLGNYAPYGYRKDPADRHRLLPEPETAAVVRRIFAYAAGGLSSRKIAVRLTALGVETPSQWKRKRGQDLGRRENSVWAVTTIRKMLSHPVYLGHMVQGKEKKVSYKSRKTRACPPREWIVVRNTHPPLVTPEVFGQAARGRKGYFPPPAGERRGREPE